MNNISLKKKSLFKLGLLTLLSFIFFSQAIAQPDNVPVGKPVYCDTSSGMSVLNNGNYSKSYCRYSAIMNYQTLHGCCSWAGGVLAVKNGNVICKNGTLSAICSLQAHEDKQHEVSDGTVSLDSDEW